VLVLRLDVPAAPLKDEALCADVQPAELARPELDAPHQPAADVAGDALDYSAMHERAPR
jgi:hypothetical protein